ncbi:GL22129 [Drosophila persimilis]|uniref:GL22129 n=1 Tax=Drosophila persimilis TaxID=7234 RepID=B4GF28_DROPE|nr:GL22129 [Drosophila persimilis]
MESSSNDNRTLLSTAAANTNLKKAQFVAYTLLFPKNSVTDLSKILNVKFKAIQGIQFTILIPKEPKRIILTTPKLIDKKAEQSEYIDNCKNKGFLMSRNDKDIKTIKEMPLQAQHENKLKTSLVQFD